MRYDLRPAQQGRVVLFRHTGEAIVFWLAMAGLLVVALLSVFRYTALKSVLAEYRALPPPERTVAAEAEPVQARIDSLVIVQGELRRTIGRLEAALAERPLDGAPIGPDQTPALQEDEPLPVVKLPLPEEADTD